MKNETCGYCLAEIAADEQAFLLNNHVVCEECYKIDYVKVAKFQWYLLTCLLAFLTMFVVYAAVAPNLRISHKMALLQMIGLVVVFVTLSTIVIVIVLMRAMKWHAVNIVLYLIGVSSYLILLFLSIIIRIGASIGVFSLSSFRFFLFHPGCAIASLLISLFCVLLIVRAATRLLRFAGYRVRLMGVKPSDLSQQILPKDEQKQ